MTALDVVAAVRELEERVIGLFVDNIYQLRDGSILLKLRGKEGVIWLIADSLGRVGLTRAEYPKPKTPPGFCALLRSKVRGGRVVKVEQLNDDRVVALTIERRDGKYILVFELVRGFNVVLLNSEKLIVNCLHPKRMKDRLLLPKEPYKPPPLRGLNPYTCSLEEFKQSLLEAKGKVAGVIVRGFNVAGEIAEEACFRAGISKDSRVEALKEEEIVKLHRALIDLYGEVKEKPLEPNVVYVEEKPHTVLPVEFKSVEGRRERYDSFNEALDHYFLKLRQAMEEQRRAEALSSEERRLQEVLRQQKARLEALRKQSEVKRKAAELLMSRLLEVQASLNDLTKLLRSGIKGAEVVERVKAGLGVIVNVDLASRKALVSLDGVEVELDYTMSAAQNASRLYEEAKEAERKAKSVEEAMKQAEEKLKEAEAEEKAPIKPARIKAWYEKFRWFFSSDGLLVIGGRDSSQNELLVRRYMEDDDLFIHAEVHGAPVVLVKKAGLSPPQATIREAAQFALAYSKAWKEGRLLGDAYWVKPSQVSKTPPSGEYLAKGSFMIRGERNYVKGLSLLVAIGLDHEDRLIGGPPDAIAKKAKVYVLLAPGEQRVSKLAREVADKLGLKASAMDEIHRLLPPGGGRILRVVKA